MPKFIVQQGYCERGEIDLSGEQVAIGREPDNDLVIPDGEVSRHHARLVSRRGRFYLEDLDSINGTFLNQVPVKKPTEIKHLDVVQISGNVFVYTDGQPNIEDAPRDHRKTQATYTIEFLRLLVRDVEANITKVFRGNPQVVRNLLLCVLADGHVLIEDAPGVGKTILARAFAKSVQGSFRRIQFTPDLLPSDITGLSLWDEKEQAFRFMPGPIFGHVILADEINRTTPRTQSSLLECMSESAVTVDGKSHVLPKPFFVIATQNPTEFHGTYPLPEAQLDRFLMRLDIGHPSAETEREILASQARSHPLNSITYVAKTMDLVQCQAMVREVHVSAAVQDYIVAVAQATRSHEAVQMGVSPRASLALMRASQALAAYQGRTYVLPSDVRELAAPVLSHRLVLKLRAQAELQSAADVVAQLLADLPVDDPADAPTSPPTATGSR